MPFPDIIYPGGAHIEILNGAQIGVDDGTTTTVVFHEERALSRPIERWRKPAFLALLRACARQKQELESLFWDVLVMNFLDYAEGNQLDVWGRRVQVGRNGRSDPAYRARIKAQIRIFQSRGRVPDITAVLNLVTGARFRYVTFASGDAFFAIIFEELPESIALGGELAEITFLSAAAGVGASVTVPVPIPGLIEAPIRFSDEGDGELPYAGGGFGDITAYVGGTLSDYAQRGNDDG